MKDLKKKLTASVAMLGVSAVMLSGVSYAWYTLSTNPEVKGISATAVANENLEIALDNAYTAGSEIDEASNQTSPAGAQGSTTANNYTWGNLVDVSTIIGAQELRPATYTANTGIQIPSYGTDGRIDSSKAYTTLTDETYAKDSASAGIAKSKSGDVQYAFKTVYWLRTNKQGAVSLTSTAVERDDTNDTSVTGQGSYISTDAFKGVYKNTNDAVKVVFKITKDDTSKTVTWVEATNGTITDNKVPLTADLGSFDANTAYKVEMYVYLNGLKVTNAMATTDINDLTVNVQFDNAAISADGAMQK